ncbi:zinc finger BED domain-containing protein 5-like [Diabrotica undecimpunctata]|uniref:zinc finger BED domain-containing protein 5-like n=1 Tax=Diabrotica undecimpunctata TaxID=50387 RepID=UPI003B638E2A
MRRIDYMGQDVVSQIISGLKSCKFFSLALDESCDNTKNAQLSIFVRYTNDNFENAEELLDLRQLVTTTGEDIFQQLKNVIEVNKVEWSKLDSVCTDGAPCMVGRLKGFVTLLENYLRRKVFKYHCIIHQKALCAKDQNMSSVVDPVTCCINKIRARALNRRQFRELFAEETEQGGELLLHCSVRWLSKGNALERFWNLKECVLKYLQENNELPKYLRKFMLEEDENEDAPNQVEDFKDEPDTDAEDRPTNERVGDSNTKESGTEEGPDLHDNLFYLEKIKPLDE